MSLYDKIDETLNEQLLMEFANLRKDETGLPVNIWIDELGADRQNKHYRPRIKFQNDYGDRINLSNMTPISIDQNPEIIEGKCEIKKKDLKEIINFILDNQNVLMKHWNREIGTMQLFNQLKFRNK